MRSLLVLVALALGNANSESCPERVDEMAPENGNVTAEDTNRNKIRYVHSPTDLQALNKIENNLFTIIKHYVEKLDSEPKLFFKSYIADYESSVSAVNNRMNGGNERGPVFYTNPILSYRMIRRFVTNIRDIKNAVFSNNDLETKEAFRRNVPTAFHWPTLDDLKDAMENFLNIYRIYGLNLSEFSRGIIGNVVTNANLYAFHCLEVARHCIKERQFTLATVWLKIAKKKALDANRHPILDNVGESHISLLFDNIVEQFGELWRDEPRHSLNLKKYFNDMNSDYVLTTRKAVAKPGDNVVPDHTGNEAYRELCQGKNLQSEKEKSQLYCWYESKINPAWYINPQKMELHSKDPYIYQVYDFIGPELIKYLKKESIPLMKRAMVATANVRDTTETNSDRKPGIHGIYSERRTNMYAWLREYRHEPKLPSLSQRIGYLTGLDTSYGKSRGRNSLQIAMYASGGYFLPHIDPLQDIDSDHLWDGLATFMLYLNNVELGGSTVFTVAGVAIPPVKGSALYWFNIKYNGEKDIRTQHGGCPVLLGEKWVGNDWIFSHRNLFNRKCTLNKDE